MHKFCQTFMYFNGWRKNISVSETKALNILHKCHIIHNIWWVSWKLPMTFGGARDIQIENNLFGRHTCQIEKRTVCRDDEDAGQSGLTVASHCDLRFVWFINSETDSKWKWQTIFSLWSQRLENKSNQTSMHSVGQSEGLRLDFYQQRHWF